MRKISALIAIGLAASAAAASAQTSDARFQREVLERLDRIERLLMRQGAVASPEPAAQAPPAATRPASGRPEISAETNLRCGFAGADCVGQATAYCRRAGYGHGVPSRIETRGELAFLVRVTCVE